MDKRAKVDVLRRARLGMSNHVFFGIDMCRYGVMSGIEHPMRAIFGTL